jgi:DNA-binding PadR family transcriptional regulator
VPERQVSNPLALAVLAWLLLEPMHPYELGRRLTETGQDRNIKFNRGSLYMVVRQLEKAGFVAASEPVKDTARPERTVYALTPSGRTELFDWLRALVTDPQREYPQFGVALSLLSVLDPIEAAGLLERRRSALGGQIAECRTILREAQQADVAWVFLIEEEYRLSQLQAEHRFVGRLISSLEDPAYVRDWNQFVEGKMR